MSMIEQGVSAHNKGDFNTAEDIYLKCLKDEPNNAYLNNLLGLLYSQTQKYAQAESFLKHAIELENNDIFLENLGICYYLQKKYELSMSCLQQALEKTPKDLERIRDFAKLAKDSEQWEYAIKFYSKSVELDKRDSVGLNNIGMSYEKLRQYDKAKPYYERSLRIKPNYSAYHNLGVLYRRERDFEQSVRYLKRALQIQPDNVDTCTSLGMSYLSLKDFENGYKYYKRRSPDIRAKFLNEWHGEEFKEDTLLIYPDGGRGDQLMFCRYIPLVQKYFKNVIFLVFRELKDFFAQNFEQITVCDFDDKYEYQHSVNLMEMHYVLGLDFDHIPFSEGYLKADETKVKEYREKHFNNNKLKVGLFWQGNLKVFHYRSASLKEFEPLFDVANCQFYSCQKGDGIEQVDNYSQIVNLGKDFNDYTDTAAALKNLDVLITIDSSIVHLSGALGVKTFLLLPYASEWRWWCETKKTDWYDCVEIFKQEKLYDWSVPVNNIVQRLKEMAQDKN